MKEAKDSIEMKVNISFVLSQMAEMGRRPRETPQANATTTEHWRHAPEPDTADEWVLPLHLVSPYLGVLHASPVQTTAHHIHSLLIVEHQFTWSMTSTCSTILLCLRTPSLFTWPPLMQLAVLWPVGPCPFQTLRGASCG